MLVIDFYIFCDVDGRYWRCIIDVVQVDGVYGKWEFSGS